MIQAASSWRERALGSVSSKETRSAGVRRRGVASDGSVGMMEERWWNLCVCVCAEGRNGGTAWMGQGLRKQRCHLGMVPIWDAPRREDAERDEFVIYQNLEI
ncbi:unnamed protein product [Chondrus crispus]|uniref:Uncharacterized protein n=1 Tax=Chondrus crispus TaxID=2769 RepID=R7QG06_CHOCR|nr:unnamed protein product [Chondrus crispus]CDF36355.1 unnamed protein product [Chondrus crispus]|eukprot:XP_005716174.1 unnamed protein product [Chondrus crispus]